MSMNNKRKKGLLNQLLSDPQARNEDVDDPKVTYQRREIIQSKKMLKSIYDEWYAMQIEQIPHLSGKLLEVGSGAGFFDEVYQDAFTSEVFYCPFVDMILNGMRLPFPEQSLKAIVMTDVFHHIPDVEQFLNEALRVLEPGGRIIMVEPWVTGWSRWVMDHFHSEPMDIAMETWQFPSDGPLSSSNQALPWIVFERDLPLFEKKFPTLTLYAIRPFMPFRYVLSGGVSMKALVPAGCNQGLKAIEGWFNPQKWAMFALIVLEKK